MIEFPYPCSPLCHRAVLHADSGCWLAGLTGDIKRTVHQKQRTIPHRWDENIIHTTVSAFRGLRPGQIYIYACVFKRSCVYQALCLSKSIISIWILDTASWTPDVSFQETPDFVNSLSLKVEIQQQNADVNPVLDRSSVSAWEFFVSHWAATLSLHLLLFVFLRESPGTRAEDSPDVLQMFVEPFEVTQSARALMITGFSNLNGSPQSREVPDTRVFCFFFHGSGSGSHSDSG